MSAQYHNARKAHVCYKCRARPSGGEGGTKSMCPPCAEEHRQAQRNRVSQAAGVAMCEKCFDRPKADGSRLCERDLDMIRRRRLGLPPVHTRSTKIHWHNNGQGKQAPAPPSPHLARVALLRERLGLAQAPGPTPRGSAPGGEGLRHSA